MPKIKVTWFDRFRRMFRNKLKPFLVDEKYKVIPAFSIGNVDYFMFDSDPEIPAGRFMSAMAIYAEMECNADKKYLTDHCKAMDKVLSDTKKISLVTIMQLNKNLQERLELMPFPDFIYKFASVIFFDKEESLFAYDYAYNEKKIERWKAAGGALDFFCKTPLRELVPSLTLPERDFQTYLTVSQLISETHLGLLTGILSEEK
jgi:hypothetical protein